MHAARLPEAIDTADALLEAERRPWQLEVHDEPAAVMEIETFARCVGREKHHRFARRETAQRIEAFASTEPAMQLQRRDVRELRGQMVKRVAVLGEDNYGLARTPDQSPQRAQLAFRRGGGRRELEQRAQPSHLLD